MSLWFEKALLPDGWRRRVRLEIRDGFISSLTGGVEPERGDACFGPAIPGMANLHSHAFQRAIAGQTEIAGGTGDDFWTWRERMYAFLDRMGPEELEAVAALAYAEMLESGYTRVGEFHYVHHDEAGRLYSNPARMAEAVAAAAQASGIGLTLLPVFYAHSGVGGKQPTQRQRRFISSVDYFAELVAASRSAVREVAAARVGIAPHSLRAVTRDELDKILTIDTDGPVHIHIAEQEREISECLEVLGARPVEWLMDNAAVGPDWCLVHATHVTDAELASIAKRGAVVGLCPITEANLGDGIFPARRFLELGGKFGVGTDSNVEIDLAGELRMLEYSQRLSLRQRNMLAGGEGGSTGTNLWQLAYEGGAAATGQTATGISVGSPADIVSFRREWADADHLFDTWIFTRSGRSMVDSVWRHGEQLVSGGRHVARDSIERRFREIVRN